MPSEPSHHLGGVLLGVIVVLVVSRLGAELATRIGQPAVLGELILGIAVGNLGLIGIHLFEHLKTDQFLDILAQIGVVLLLFDVGLESRLQDMRRVGLSSLIVATLGVAAPFLFGWAVSRTFTPQASAYVHVFVGATLCATSVGITARVFQDLRRVDSPEARIILGAAVIDDVQGLVILSLVQGLITAAGGNATLSASGIAVICLKAVLFLAGGIAVGLAAAPRLFTLASTLQARGALLPAGLVFCFVFAYAAEAVGLAPIVGAFTAGLILEEVHYKELSIREERTLRELLNPVISVTTPIFFVLMGMRADLGTFANISILGFAGALTVAAAVGKQVCSFGVLQRGVNKLVVGLGMIPRGEVGLIFAYTGSHLLLNQKPVVDPATYSAIVIMVIVTTLATPLLLKAAFREG
ncbi:MAG: cation:proton antiporter [Armatimonadota bacterium]